MRHTRIQTPKGTRDFLPEEAAVKAALESGMAKTFETWGYSRVITPTCEFQDVVTLGQGGITDDSLYKLFDREGNTLALRPDMTMPIGRIAAVRLKDYRLPYRVFYIANVFRHTGIETGRQREFYQAGVELLGAPGAAADSEIIALAASILEKTGLTGICFDIGHVGFVSGLLKAGNFEGPEEEAVIKALISKDYAGLREILSAHTKNPGIAASLSQIPGLRGGREVIDKARPLAAGIPSAEKALDEIEEVMDYLADYGVGVKLSIDLGMVKDFDYYTGVIIEGYVRELGAALCSGGRYDSLTEHFGFPCPATGFAIGVEWLLSALARQGKSGDIPATITPDAVAVLPAHNTPGCRKSALGFIDSLRESGFRVMVELVPRTPEETKAFALERGAEWLIRFNDDGLRGELHNLALGHSHGTLPQEGIMSVLRGEKRLCDTTGL